MGVNLEFKQATAGIKISVQIGLFFWVYESVLPLLTTTTLTKILVVCVWLSMKMYEIGLSKGITLSYHIITTITIIDLSPHYPNDKHFCSHKNLIR